MNLHTNDPRRPSDSRSSTSSSFSSSRSYDLSDPSSAPSSLPHRRSPTLPSRARLSSSCSSSSSSRHSVDYRPTSASLDQISRSLAINNPSRTFLPSSQSVTSLPVYREQGDSHHGSSSPGRRASVGFSYETSSGGERVLVNPYNEPFPPPPETTMRMIPSTSTEGGRSITSQASSSGSRSGYSGDGRMPFVNRGCGEHQVQHHYSEYYPEGAHALEASAYEYEQARANDSQREVSVPSSASSSSSTRSRRYDNPPSPQSHRHPPRSPHSSSSRASSRRESLNPSSTSASSASSRSSRTSFSHPAPDYASRPLSDYPPLPPSRTSGSSRASSFASRASRASTSRSSGSSASSQGKGGSLKSVREEYGPQDGRREEGYERHRPDDQLPSFQRRGMGRSLTSSSSSSAGRSVTFSDTNSVAADDHSHRPPPSSASRSRTGPRPSLTHSDNSDHSAQTYRTAHSLHNPYASSQTSSFSPPLASIPLSPSLRNRHHSPSLHPPSSLSRTQTFYLPPTRPLQVAPRHPSRSTNPPPRPASSMHRQTSSFASSASSFVSTLFSRSRSSSSQTTSPSSLASSSSSPRSNKSFFSTLSKAPPSHPLSLPSTLAYMSEKPEPRTTGVGLGLGLLLGGAASGKITDKFPISEDFKHGIVASMASEAGGGGGGLGSIGGGGGGDGGGIGGATRAIGVVREKKWPLAKIALLLSVCTIFVYALLGLGWSLTIWFRTQDMSDVTLVADRDVLIFLTFASFFCLFTAVVGLCGTLLNNRAILAFYNVLLWPALLSICFVGYTSYKREDRKLDRKLNQAWSQFYDDLDRLRIQNALHCCGFYNPLHDATFSKTCYPRSALPGCKGVLYRFEKFALAQFATAAFATVPFHLLNIVVGLLCSNHVNNTFGKGITPKQYRLNMADVRTSAQTVLTLVNQRKLEEESRRQFHKQQQQQQQQQRSNRSSRTHRSMNEEEGSRRSTKLPRGFDARMWRRYRREDE